MGRKFPAGCALLLLLGATTAVHAEPGLFKSANTTPLLARSPKVVRIDSASLSYGDKLALDLAAAARIGRVAAIGPISATFSFYGAPRFIPARFRQAGKSVYVTMPGNENVAPPGYYTVFLLDASGRLSKGVIVLLGRQRAQPILALDASRSFQSVNDPDRLMRHSNFLGYIAAVNADSSDLAKLDAAFSVRPGLGDGTCYSLESRNYPGYFLRHTGFRLRINPFEDAALYRMDATFCAKLPLTGASGGGPVVRVAQISRVLHPSQKFRTLARPL